MKKYIAEFVGTLWLVLGGCGSAVLAAAFLADIGPDATTTHIGIGLLGVSFAFGLTVLTMAYTIGHISGCHLNPAVSIGLCVGGRFSAAQLGPYIAAQVLGGVAGAGILFVIATSNGADIGGFATNGFGAAPEGAEPGGYSPGGYSMMGVLITEVVMTAMFLFIIMGATDGRAPAGMAPLAIGLGLTLIHLISIPVSNTSVNPARSLGVAVFTGGAALSQVWLFWVAPIVGAVIGAVTYKFVASGEED